MPTGEGDDSGRRENTLLQQQKNKQQLEARARASQAGALRNQFMEKHNANLAGLEQQKQAYDTDIGAQQQTALQQLMERNAAMRAQADLTLSQPAQAPIQFSTPPPLEGVSAVNPNAAMAGGNAATQAFYLSPESSQSQFSVGAPVGGGGIGQRQKSTTDDLTSRTDSLGARRKDEM